LQHVTDPFGVAILVEGLDERLLGVGDELAGAPLAALDTPIFVLAARRAAEVLRQGAGVAVSLGHDASHS